MGKEMLFSAMTEKAKHQMALTKGLFCAGEVEVGAVPGSLRAGANLMSWFHPALRFPCCEQDLHCLCSGRCTSSDAHLVPANC